MISRTLLRRTTRMALVAAGLALPACSNALVLKPPVGPMPSTVRERAVLVDGDGRPLRVLTPSEYAMERSIRRAHMSEAEYDLYLARMMDAIRRDTAMPRRIMIVAHGGLNQLRTNLNGADDIAASIRDAGYNPILLIWDSSLQSTYVEHLFFVRQGQRREGSAHVLQGTAHLLSDVGRGVSQAPLTWFEQADDLYRTTAWSTPKWRGETHLLRAKYEALVSAIGAGTATEEQDLATLRLSVGEYRPTRGEKIGRSLLTIFTAPTKLIGSPVLDAFGGSAWRNMQRRTRTMYHNPDEFSPKVITADRYRAPSGAVARLATALDSLIITDSVAFANVHGRGARWDRHERWEITLIGHSMGAIVMNELVRHFYDLPYRNIVYMAAACSIRDWEASVLPYMEEHHGTRFYSLMLHPTVEARERNLGDLPPRGSLLEWLDDYMHDPETHVDRMLGKWANMAEATHLIPPGVRNRVYFRVFGYRDALTNHGEGGMKPIKHGDFLDPDVPFYLPQFWWPYPDVTVDDEQ